VWTLLRIKYEPSLSVLKLVISSSAEEVQPLALVRVLPEALSRNLPRGDGPSQDKQFNRLDQHA